MGIYIKTYFVDMDDMDHMHVVDIHMDNKDVVDIHMDNMDVVDMDIVVDDDVVFLVLVVDHLY